MEPKKNLWKILAIGIVFVAVLAVAAFFIRQDIDTRLAVLQKVKADVQNKQQALQTLASLQADSERAKKYTPEIDGFLVTRDQLLGFSRDAATLIQQGGFTGSTKFKEEMPPLGDLQRTGLLLTLDGQKSLDDISRLLALFEQGRYYVRFNSADITQDKGAVHVVFDGAITSF